MADRRKGSAVGFYESRSLLETPIWDDPDATFVWGFDLEASPQPAPPSEEPTFTSTTLLTNSGSGTKIEPRRQ